MSEKNKSIFNLTKDELIEKGVTIAQHYLIKRGYKVEDTFTFDDIKFIYASDCNTPVLIKFTCNAEIGGDCMPEFETDDNAIQQAKNCLGGFLNEHEDIDYCRFDLIAVKYLDTDKASLRHLIKLEEKFRFNL